jgi:hypothetical protein
MHNITKYILKNEGRLYDKNKAYSSSAPLGLHRHHYGAYNSGYTDIIMEHIITLIFLFL